MPAPASLFPPAADLKRQTQTFRWAVCLLGAITALRLVVAAAVPLSADEAYYWTWSRALAPGYLDHPPMVAVWIWLGTQLGGQTALGVRLLGPISAALGSVLLARSASSLCPGVMPGVKAAALFNATLLMAAGAVTMTPDTPLLFFWTAALYAVVRLCVTGRPAWWLAIGACAGLALDSKYTASLFGLGLAVWLIATPAGRRWLRTPWPWLGGLMALLLFAPVIAWNAAHGWASFEKQGGRTADWQPRQALAHLAELVGSQAGLATPGVAVLCAVGLWHAVRRWRTGAGALLACLSVPAAIVFLEHALGDRVQANWPAILFPAGCIAAACYCPRFWKPCAAFGYALSLLVYFQAATGIIPLPRRFDPTLIRLGGWDDLASQVAEAGLSGSARFVAADNYGLAAMMAFELPAIVVGTEPRWRLFDFPQAQIEGEAGLLIHSRRRAGGPDPEGWSGMVRVGGATRRRNGVVAEEYDLYRVIARHDMVRLPVR